MQKKKQIKKIKKKHVVEFENNSFLTELYGNHDQNLAKFENYFNISISYRGNKLEISGDQESSLMAADKIMELYNELDNGIKLGIKDVDVFLKSKKIDKDNFLIKTNNKKIYARSKNQEIFVNAININDLIFGIGPAGTGKTYLAVAAAVQCLLKNQISRIILSRPAVEAGERLGFLPGDLKEKIDPYLRPLYDALNDLMPKKILENYIDNGIIEIAPLAFMRGRTLENAFIILDEAQNTTNMQMKMFVTRLGRNSKMVILGDITQIDLPKGSTSGLKEILKLIPKEKGIDTIKFQSKDIVRHRLVDKIVRAYSKPHK
tara:strand:- start:1113 stop:2066 length:954 start_codon:yes stop_codon:yes gene_type:complete